MVLLLIGRSLLLLKIYHRWIDIEVHLVGLSYCRLTDIMSYHSSSYRIIVDLLRCWLIHTSMINHTDLLRCLFLLYILSVNHSSAIFIRYRYSSAIFIHMHIITYAHSYAIAIHSHLLYLYAHSYAIAIHSHESYVKGNKLKLVAERLCNDASMMNV